MNGRNKTIYLVRGVSGSGKTTLAKEMTRLLGSCAKEISADNYFYQDGVYLFDVNKLDQAHNMCKYHTEKAMAEGCMNIFVHNTFTREKEIAPYTELAEKYGYKVVSMIVENRHGNSSVHDVPEETLKKQKDRFSVKL